MITRTGKIWLRWTLQEELTLQLSMGLVSSSYAGVQSYVSMTGSLVKTFRNVNLKIGTFRNMNLKTGEKLGFSSFGSLQWRDDSRNEVQSSAYLIVGRALCDSHLRPWLGLSCLASCRMDFRNKTFVFQRHQSRRGLKNEHWIWQIMINHQWHLKMCLKRKAVQNRRKSKCGPQWIGAPSFPAHTGVMNR